MFLGISARHLTLTVSVVNQVCEWVLTNLMLEGGGVGGGSNPAMDWHPIQGEVEILLVAPRL